MNYVFYGSCNISRLYAVFLFFFQSSLTIALRQEINLANKDKGQNNTDVTRPAIRNTEKKTSWQYALSHKLNVNLQAITIIGIINVLKYVMAKIIFSTFIKHNSYFNETQD